MWGINYLTKGKFELPHLQDFVKEGTDVNSSIGNYFSTMLDQSMNWKDAENLCSKWGGHFALKGIMSVEDAKSSRHRMHGYNGIKSWWKTVRRI